MPDDNDIPPPKDELPYHTSIVINRHYESGQREPVACFDFRIDGHIKTTGEATFLQGRMLAQAAARVFARVLAPELASPLTCDHDWHDDPAVGNLLCLKCSLTRVRPDPIVQRINQIQQAAGDTLAPETATLMELAKEAQLTGEMPDLSRLRQPADLPCCQ